MRLIDADALADALFDRRKSYPNWVADTIGNMPDAVVRCKDCKNSGLDSSGTNGYWCSAHAEWHDGDWFCADGKMRDEHDERERSTCVGNSEEESAGR